MANESPDRTTWAVTYPTPPATPSATQLSYNGATVTVMAILTPLKGLQVLPKSNILQPDHATSFSGVWVSLDKNTNAIVFGKDPRPSNTPMSATKTPGDENSSPQTSSISQSTSTQAADSLGSTASSTSSPTLPSAAKGSGLSSGAIAGIAIACLVAGALTASLLF
ncbi:hypothetical protein ACJQWK_01235 [Exserohilum turcicum]